MSINGTKVECKGAMFECCGHFHSVLMEPKWNVKLKDAYETITAKMGINGTKVECKGNTEYGRERYTHTY